MEWRWYGAVIIIVIAVALAMGVASPSSSSVPCWGEGVVVVCHAGLEASLSLLSAMLG